MNQGASRWARPATRIGLSAALLALGGCCPSGVVCDKFDDDEVNGFVIDGPIQGATVCLDANGNGTCDANELVSSTTDAQGRYKIIVPWGQGQASAAPLLAMVPANAVDAGNPAASVGKAFTLSAPAGKGSVISPITTLIQAAVAQGMTLEQAEAAVAAQLQIAAASLYNNYTLSSAGDNAALATLAPSIVAGLKAGAPVVVTAPAASTVDYHVRAFTLGSAGAYTLRLFYAPTSPAGSGLSTFYDVRSGIAGGNPVATGTLYDSALLSTAQGWAPNTGATAHTITGGSPSVLTYAGGYKYVATRAETDVAGQPVADAARLAQDLTVNTFSTLVGVNPATVTGTMPAGAKVQKFTMVGMEAPVGYRASDGSVSTAVPTLPAMVTAYPAPSAPTPGNTLSMGTLRGSAGCATAVCTQEFLRVAFAPRNAAAYYLCDVDRATDVQSNCIAAGSGSYTLGKAADGNTPIMKFAGLPTAAAVQTFTRVFVERGGRVNLGFEDKTVTSTSTRLNKVAFEALALALGITPPKINAAVSPYVGAWTAAYTGDDTGSCPTGAIDALGNLSGSCSSAITLQAFIVSGTVSTAGVADFTAAGGSSTGARFAGTLAGTAGSGTWTLPIPLKYGTWTATKQP